MNILFNDLSKKTLSGITLKSTNLFENGNLALHATENDKQIMKNREIFTEQLSLPLNALTIANQTHSDNFYKVTATDKGRGATTMDNAIPNTDALYTDEPGILLGTLTADCVPVTFYDHSKKIVGVIHSGWQGTVKEITSQVFSHLKQYEQSNPENILVHLGPALSQQKFEVDYDVYEKYLQLGYADPFIYDHETTGKYHIDNQKVVQKQCEMAGIPTTQITSDQTCTFLSKNHFSYRENRQAGRHLSFIMMK